MDQHKHDELSLRMAGVERAIRIMARAMHEHAPRLADGVLAEAHLELRAVQQAMALPPERALECRRAIELLSR